MPHGLGKALGSCTRRLLHTPSMDFHLRGFQLRRANLRESEQQFHSLSDSIPQLVWMADGAGRIFWVNNRWYEYTGQSRNDGGGQDWLALLDPALLPEVRLQWAEALRDGWAMGVWRRMIRAQGGDPDAPLPVAPETCDVCAPASGYLTRLDAYGVGVASWRLGAGRSRKEDPVSATAGVTLHAKPGDRVREGEPLLTLHADSPDRFARALEALEGAYDIADELPELPPLIIDRIA